MNTLAFFKSIGFERWVYYAIIITLAILFFTKGCGNKTEVVDTPDITIEIDSLQE